MRRVVVTGLGVCAPNGTGVSRFWDALVHGRSGVAPVRAFDASALKSRIAGEVTDFDPESRLSTKSIKRSTRFMHLAIVAAMEALEHAGFTLPTRALVAAGGSGNGGANGGNGRGNGGANGGNGGNGGDIAPVSPELNDTAVIVGSGIGGFDMLEREHITFLSRGPGRMHPLTVPMIIPNMAAGAIAMETGCRGPNLCISTACATGGHSIGTAFDMIRSGRADVAVAGASESTISPYAVDGYCQLRALSTRNDDPEGASRPFSRDRDGFVIAEGAGILILEELAHAKKRRAPIYAELVGYGATADGYHVTAPDPDAKGAVRAMRAALEDAKLAPEAIGLVNAHGTSTPLNDVTETNAIKNVFGAHARRLAVNSTKSMIGHALGGASAIEAVACVLMLERGVLHPTINLKDPDPACDLDYVPLVAREAKVDAIMSNAFGFGGHNAVLVFRKFGG
ncbi:MAG: beta-ketoacyl-[acyl-carrier-protein] synthase family protein [Candidatus Eiseniibacteriota bacterium]